MFGRIEEAHCGIWYSAERMEELLETLPSLWIDEFEGLADEEIFLRFDQVIYTGPLDEEVPPERTAQFKEFDFLTNWGEHTNGFKGCIVLHPEWEVGMMVRLPDDSIICRRIDPDLFTHVAKTFVEWYWQEEARLRPEN